jgi:hypothetical protein
MTTATWDRSPSSLVRSLVERVTTVFRRAADRDRALSRVNETFHRLYDAARAERADEAPLLVVLPTALVLCRGSDETRFSLERASLDVLKCAAHAPIALFSALDRSLGTPLPDGTRTKLLDLESALLASLDARTDLDADSRSDLRLALLRSTAFLDSVLARNEVSQAALAAFARESEPVLGRLVHRAARLQLDTLHDRMEAAWKTLSERDRGTLRVVVTGERQARARNLPMQYFEQRFGDRSRGTERVRDRVIYAECVRTVEEARSLAATRALDRIVAKAFFGDETRLSEDVLGDAAADVLRERRRVSSAA